MTAAGCLDAVRRLAAAGVVTAAGHTDASYDVTPACALGLTGVGAVRPGHRADLVVLDPDLRVRAVMAGGRWTHPDHAAGLTPPGPEDP